MSNDPTTNANPTDTETEAAEPTTADTLWKVITRYDAYMTSTNPKAAVIIAYNAIIVGGIVLKYTDVLGIFATHPKAQNLVGALLAIATAVSLVSIWLTFQMILPYLWSPPAYHSMLYFEDVAKQESGEKYLAALQATDGNDLLTDLAKQAHALAMGASTKFRSIWWAISLILYVQLIALAAVLVTKLALLF